MFSKIKERALALSAKIAGIGAIVSTAIYAGAAKAALDAQQEAVASSTVNTLKTTFADYLVYVIPGVLSLFLLFWGFKFVVRWMRKFAH